MTTERVVVAVKPFIAQAMKPQSGGEPAAQAGRETERNISSCMMVCVYGEEMHCAKKRESLSDILKRHNIALTPDAEAKRKARLDDCDCWMLGADNAAHCKVCNPIEIEVQPTHTTQPSSGDAATPPTIPRDKAIREALRGIQIKAVIEPHAGAGMMRQALRDIYVALEALLDAPTTEESNG